MLCYVVTEHDSASCSEPLSNMSTDCPGKISSIRYITYVRIIICTYVDRIGQYIYKIFAHTYVCI